MAACVVNRSSCYVPFKSMAPFNAGTGGGLVFTRRSRTVFSACSPFMSSASAICSSRVSPVEQQQPPNIVFPTLCSLSVLTVELARAVGGYDDLSSGKSSQAESERRHIPFSAKLSLGRRQWNSSLFCSQRIFWHSQHHNYFYFGLGLRSQR